jgi:predicted nucleotidyltransferase
MSLNHIIKQRQKKNTILKEEVMNEAERLVKLLKEQFDFETIYIFGSLATGRFRRHSDIDMAVKGMKIEDYFKAYALLIKESRFDVDLKPFEDLSKNLK